MRTKVRQRNADTLKKSADNADTAPQKQKEETMTITLDEDYFAVASEALLGYCGEKNSREISFSGLDNITADMYSLVLSYDDGVSYEARIQNDTLALDNSLMRKAGPVDVQVYACNMQGDEYTVVRKSNILQLFIKPSLDDNAPPVPTIADCLRILGKIEQCAEELTELGDRLVDEQAYLDRTQQQITEAQRQLMQQFNICLLQMNAAVQTAQQCAQQIADSANQIMINKSATGLQKRNLLKIGTSGYDDGNVTVTVDAQGRLTVNGSTGSLYQSVPLTSDTAFDDKKHIPNGSYIICTNGFDKLAVVVTGYKYVEGNIQQRSLAWCEGNDVSFTVDDEFPYNYVELYLDRETTFDSDLVLPMIRYQGVADNTWEPFTPDLKMRIDELSEKIDALSFYNETQADSISDSISEVIQ